MGPDRRRVLYAGAAGIFSLTLPAAAAHATGDQAQGESLAAPTGVAAAPIGYVGESTGAIRITWNPVTGATGYSVGWATTSGGNGDYTPIDVGNVTSYDLTGRVGTDTTHYLVVTATDGTTTSLNSTEVSSSPVIATGGNVTPVSVGGSVAYVEHRFLTPGTYSDASAFRLNRTYQLDELIVAGGGGGGNGWDSAPGGGGGAGGFRLRTGVPRTVTPGTPEVLTVVVGAGGAGGAGDGTSTARDGTDGDTSSLGDISVAGGGGGGAARNAGRAGGSGGGAGGRGPISSTRAGGTATADGNVGGESVSTADSSAGGGGGGGAASAGSRPGDGEGGLTAGGSGGGARTTAVGGIAGAAKAYARGGDGGSYDATEAVGATATAVGAGGSGGTSASSGSTAGGAGADGAVVVRYALPTAADPATPTGLSVVPAGRTGTGNGAIEVSWTAVPGATYTVEHRRQGVGADWTATTGIGGTSTVVTGLDPALTYEARVTAVVGGVSSMNSDPESSGTVVATGGTVTTFTGDGTIGADGRTYVVHTFSSGTSDLVLARSIGVEYLLVAGGGGGGNGYDLGPGGGGGAGAMIEATATLSGTVTVTVGAGGEGGEAVESASAGQDGDPSVLGTVTALGGGGGGSSRGNGRAGGSGGGAGGRPYTTSSGVNTRTGGTAVVHAAATEGVEGTFGHAGAQQVSTAGAANGAGGGGGAGGVGTEGGDSTGGQGGPGSPSTITGTSLTYAPGGDGGSDAAQRSGAGATVVGGGGDGGSDDSNDATSSSGGSGADGVVIVRYALPA